MANAVSEGPEAENKPCSWSYVKEHVWKRAATWMLEVSTISKEDELGVDFAEIYRHSSLFR